MPARRARSAQVERKTPRLTLEQAQQIGAYIAGARRRPAAARRQRPQLGRRHRRRRRAVPGQLLVLPRVRRRWRRALLGQVRAELGDVDRPADLRRDADRPAEHAGLRRQPAQPDEKRDIIAYIQNLKSDADPGGLGIGRLGPVTEGLAIFLVGMVGAGLHDAVDCGEVMSRPTATTSHEAHARASTSTTRDADAASTWSTRAPAATASRSCTTCRGSRCRARRARSASTAADRASCFDSRACSASGFVVGVHRVAVELQARREHPQALHAGARRSRSAWPCCCIGFGHHHLGQEAAARGDLGPGAPRRAARPHDEQKLTGATMLNMVDELGVKRRPLLGMVAAGRHGAARRGRRGAAGRRSDQEPARPEHLHVHRVGPGEEPGTARRYPTRRQRPVSGWSR